MPPYSSHSQFSAVALLHDAALTLAAAAEIDARDRYLGVAVRLGLVMEDHPDRPLILAASPRVVGQSGRVFTLVEMIEDNNESDESRYHHAIRLMSELAWSPGDPQSAREVIRHNRELIVYQRLLIDRKLEGLRHLQSSGPGG